MSRLFAQRLSGRSIALLTFETTLIIGAVVIAAYARLGASAWDVFAAEHGLAKTLLMASVAQLCLYYAEMYDLRIVADRRELFVRIVQALASASFILAAPCKARTMTAHPACRVRTSF